MTATYTWTMEMQLSGVWTDVTADVRSSAPVSVSRGIDGSGVTDRVAKVGTMSFALDNSTANSGGLLGYYSPDNTNVRAGYGIGTYTRLIIETSMTITDETGDDILDEDGVALLVDGGYCKFYGKISDVTPIAGAYKERYVSVMCVDYMNELLVHNMNKLAVQAAKRGDQLVGAVVGNLPTAPLSTSYATGPDTFAYALNDVQDERTSGMNAVQRVDQSGLSYTFVRGDVVPGTLGEALVWHSRNTRFGSTSGA